jgi:hypothetical protein
MDDQQIKELLELAKQIDPQVLKEHYLNEEDEGKQAVFKALYQFRTGKYHRHQIIKLYPSKRFLS